MGRNAEGRERAVKLGVWRGTGVLPVMLEGDVAAASCRWSGQNIGWKPMPLRHPGYNA